VEANYSDVVKPEECRGRPEERFACFVRFEGGVFRMGAQSSEPASPNHAPGADADEGPVHEVTLAPFYLQAQEIAAIQFETCVKRGACRAEDVGSGGGFFNAGDRERPDFPANGVTHRGATDYCRMIGARLPTEAEFEFALQAAARGSGGTTCDSAVVRAAGGRKCRWDASVEIYRAASASGMQSGQVQHLAGNVWEWVSDWYGPYAAAPVVDPRGPASGDRRVARGAAFTTEDASLLRPSARSPLDPEVRLDDVGFRCALSKLP